MADVFPPNNLPVESRYWTREVEKRIVNSENVLSSAEINNTTRDAQIASTANQALAAALAASAAAATAQAGIDGLTGLGSAGSTYTIDVDNINVGTLTGFTIQTATSGSRMVLDGAGNAFSFYNSSTGVAHMTPLETSGGTALGLLLHAGSTPDPTASSGNPMLFISTSSVQVDTGFGESNLSVYDSSDSIYPSQIRMTAANGIHLGSYTYADSYLYYGGAPSAATGTTVIRDVNNLLRPSSSSLKYKTNVNPIDIDYQRWIDMPMVTYKYKQDVEDLGEDAPLLNGYIAEQLDEAGYKELVIYAKQEDGSIAPESVNVNSLAAGTHAVVQKQAKIIEDLLKRVEALESK